MNPLAKARGETIRRALAATVLPRLSLGAAVPSPAALGRALGVSRVAARVHLRRVLAAAGVQTAVVRRRLIVESMGG